MCLTSGTVIIGYKYHNEIKNNPYILIPKYYAVLIWGWALDHKRLIRIIITLRYIQTSTFLSPSLRDFLFTYTIFCPILYLQDQPAYASVLYNHPYNYTAPISSWSLVCWIKNLKVKNAS